MAATIKDIAKALNLSVSTVSYALNGGPKPVSEEVRAEVLRVAREIGYSPNRVARSLVTRSNRTIGVVPPQIERGSLLGEFVQLTLNAIVNAAEVRHYDLLLLTAYDRTTPEGVAQILGDSRVDAVILIGPPSEEATFRMLREHGLPFAIVGSGMYDWGAQFRADDEQGVEAAMNHLWNLGHRRIGHLAGRQRVGDAQARAKAYLKFMAERGIDGENLLYWGSFNRVDGPIAFEFFDGLPEPPTAIFCANDEMALGLMQAAQTCGLTLPDDLSIVGFDDSRDGAHARPALTSVHQPIDTMATAAFEAVMAQLEMGSPCLGATFATSLVVRESTCPPRAGVGSPG